MKTLSLLLTFLLASLLWSSGAQAEPRTHDGFYAQLGAGLGYYSASGDEPLEESLSGVTIPAQLFLGGSIVSGITLAGGFFLDYAPSPSYEAAGLDAELSVDISQFILGIGVLVDVYIDPEGGLHFQGFAGWGGLETSVEGDVGGSDPTGLVTFLGGGYDWWIADELSVGVLGRFVIAPISYEEVGFLVIEPAVLAVLTYH
jgi:hypothetical protein